MNRVSAAITIVAAIACAGRVAAQDDPARVFSYDRTRPLALEQAPYDSSATARQFLVSYASPGGGRVTGVLAVPSASGRHAGVVLLHGLPGNARGAMATQGLDLAARGAVVLAIDAPWARRNRLIDFTSRDSVEQVQLMQDLQRAVDVLLARSDVDPARLAYVGGSYGGAMGALFAGIEPRLKAFVLFVPDGGLVAHFTNPDGSPNGPLAGLPPADRARWLAAMRPIEPIAFIGRARGALLMQNGRQDQLVTVEDAEALHAAAPAGRTVRWYDGDHGLTPAAKAERWAWLAPIIGTRP